LGGCRTWLDGAFAEGCRLVVERQPPAERSIGDRVDDFANPLAVARPEYVAQHRVDNGMADAQRCGKKRNEQGKDDRAAHGFGAPLAAPGARVLRSSRGTAGDSPRRSANSYSCSPVARSHPPHQSSRTVRPP
jgi:hypothetical protein